MCFFPWPLQTGPSRVKNKSTTSRIDISLPWPVGLLVVCGSVVLTDLSLELDVGVELLVLVNVIVDDPGAAVGLLDAVLAWRGEEGKH